MNKFNVGDKVVFINAQKHKAESRFYPAVGTAGTVKKIGGVGDLLVGWGDAEGVDISYDGAKLWWCTENDIKPYVQENNYTDDEVWGMLKPKMRQLVPAHTEDIDMFSPTVKDMVVAAYRSGYGRATKGRSFMIKPKVKKAIEKPCIDDSIDDVLGGKMIVTFYKDDDSYNVANFAYSCDNGKDVEIYGDIIHCSAGDSWTFGYDIISDPDCEMYVAIPFTEEFPLREGDKVINVDNLTRKMSAGDDRVFMKPYQILNHCFNYCFTNKFYHNGARFYSHTEDNLNKLRILIPICDYLKHEGVNV